MQASEAKAKRNGEVIRPVAGRPEYTVRESGGATILRYKDMPVCCVATGVDPERVREALCEAATYYAQMRALEGHETAALAYRRYDQAREVAERKRAVKRRYYDIIQRAVGSPA